MNVELKEFHMTAAQAVALYKVYQRTPGYKKPDGTIDFSSADDPKTRLNAGDTFLTFEEFVKTVEGTFGMDGAITVPWCGMWLAIETDGYTHS